MVSCSHNGLQRASVTNGKKKKKPTTWETAVYRIKTNIKTATTKCTKITSLNSLFLLLKWHSSLHSKNTKGNTDKIVVAAELKGGVLLRRKCQNVGTVRSVWGKELPSLQAASLKCDVRFWRPDLFYSHRFALSWFPPVTSAFEDFWKLSIFKSQVPSINFLVCRTDAMQARLTELLQRFRLQTSLGCRITPTPNRCFELSEERGLYC